MNKYGRVLDNLKFAGFIAAKYRHPRISFDDLRQEAVCAMIDAEKTYAPGRGKSFVGYAQWHIRTRLRSYLLRESRERFNRISLSTTINEE